MLLENNDSQADPSYRSVREPGSETTEQIASALGRAFVSITPPSRLDLHKD